ncbi:MAG: YicC family protein [Lachnospiraceae bacterium]|nr:YicC family protein [Lachnospiraceae bacterium]
MIKSMTGFGRAEAQDQDRKFTVEIKSVNHRYLDFNIKMPKKFTFFEAAIRTTLKNYMQRGKIDVFITYEDFTQTAFALQYHPEIAHQYMNYLEQMQEEFGIKNDISAPGLARFPEVLSMEEQPVDEEKIWSLLEHALNSAGEQFAASRNVEGEHLWEDLTQKLAQMTENVKLVEKRSPQILADYREKLTNKMQDLLGDNQLDESRIAAEVILFADKICTDEETVRLESHIHNMQQVLDEGEGIGRKLDFIAQEMNREANTILSKANDLEISNIAIELKTDIEKVREQIQNIE